jgi:hypothetical protein
MKRPTKRRDIKLTRLELKDIKDITNKKEELKKDLFKKRQRRWYVKSKNDNQ